MRHRTDADARGQPRRPLGCVQCEFKCTTGNEMSRHIFATGHGTVKCPLCDTHIVPRGFVASLTKLLERSRDRPSSSQGEVKRPFTSIAISTHPHCSEVPNFRCFEKGDFELSGVAEDYNLSSDPAAYRQSDGTSTALVPSSSGGASGDAAAAASSVTYRCMECLSLCGTWTKVTKHMDKSNHTQPLCAQCFVRLRCFGPLRPKKHEESTGHCGFYGAFYTRRDYMCEVQAPRNAYNYSNSYTGFSTLQYKCVCGISFLHPLHLAEHMRRVHGAHCIPDEAVCRRCEKRGTLSDMIAHLRSGCQPTVAPTVEGGVATGAENSVSSLPGSAVRSPMPASPERAVASVYSDENVCGPAAAAVPAIEIPGFSGASFLQWRPLKPPSSDDEVQLMDESYAMSGDVSGLSVPALHPGSEAALVPAGGARKASYVILYQCRECLFLFSSWEGMVQHIRVTGHCRTYCCKCKRDLPQLVNHMTAHDTSASTREDGPPPACCDATSPTPPTVRSTTLEDHLKHLRKCGDIIGFPTSPKSLEVLVDVNAACYQGSVDPNPEQFEGDRIIMAYQCPAEGDRCYEVFLNYGNLVEHLMSTGHGTCSTTGDTSGGDTAATRRLSTCYPMVTYRAKFTMTQLQEHFGFKQCRYCECAVPHGEEELHKALCIERRQRKDLSHHHDHHYHYHHREHKDT